MGRGSDGRSRAAVTVIRFAFPPLASVWHSEQKFTKAFVFEKHPIEKQMEKPQEELKQKEKVEDVNYEENLIESKNVNIEEIKEIEEFDFEEDSPDVKYSNYEDDMYYTDEYDEYDEYNEYDEEYYDNEEYWLRKVSNQKAGFEIKRSKAEKARAVYKYITKPIIRSRGCKQIWVKNLAFEQENKRLNHVLANVVAKKVNAEKELQAKGWKRIGVKYPPASDAASTANTAPASSKREQDEINRAIQESLVTRSTATSAAAEIGLSAQQLLDLQNRELTPEDYELLLQLDASVKPKTISSSIVDSFPTRKATASDISKDPCGVCLMEFCEDEDIKSLPCGHVYHAECISKWLTERSTKCPLDGVSLEQQ